MDINNNMNIERTEQEIYAVIDQCAESKIPVALLIPV